MSTTIENFILRFKSEGTGNIKSAQKDVAGLKGGLKDLATEAGGAAQGMGGLAGEAASLGARLGPVGAAIGAVIAVTVGLGAQAVVAADALQDMATATGTNASQLMSLQASMIEAGGKADSYEKAIARLNLQIGEAADGNKSAVDAFTQLGVAFRTSSGDIRPTSDVLDDVVKKLSQVTDRSTATRLAVALMGKEMSRIDVTQLNSASDAITDAEVARLAQFQTRIDQLKTSLSNANTTFFGSLLLQLDELGAKWSKLMKENPLLAKTMLAPLNAIPGGNLAKTAIMASMAEEPSKTSRRGGAAMGASKPKFTPVEAPATPTGTGTGGGGGGPSPAQVQAERSAEALAQSQKRIAQEQARYEVTLARNNGQEITAIKLQMEQDIAEATQQIQGDTYLSAEQKAKEIAAVTKNIRLNAEQDIADVQKRQRDTMMEIYRLAQGIAQSEVDRVDDAIATQTMTSIQLDRYRAQQNLIRERARAIADLNEQLKGATPNLRRFSIAMAEISFDDAAKKIDGAFDKLEEFNKDPRAGAESVMKRMAEMSTPFQVAADQTQALFDNMNSAIDEFVRTGKFKFSDFAKSVIRDLIAIQMKAAAVELLNTVIGAIFKAPAGKAVGGNVNRGEGYMVGERGPELFVPSTTGKIHANNTLGTAPGGAGSQPMVNKVTNVNYTINAVDSLSFKQMVARDPEFIYSVTEQGKRKQPSARR